MTLVENQPVRRNQARTSDRILSFPRARVYRNGGLSVAASTDTLITWDVMHYDTDGMWDPNNPTRLYCRTAGLYLIQAWCEWATSGGTTRQMRIRINGGAKYDGGVNYAYDPGNGLPVNNASHISFPLDADDYIEMLVNQNSAGALAFDAATAGYWPNGLQATCLSLP